MNKPNPKQQIVEKIKTSQNIIIACHNNPDGDALGSGLALYHSLLKIGKKCTLAAAGKKSKNLDYLPGIDNLTNQISNPKEFVITLNTGHTQAPHKVKYKTEDQKIHLIITPEQGFFSAEDISFSEGKGIYDLIITLDTPNLEYLGDIYHQNHDMFFETPIVNIDHHPDNDSYGEINYVNSDSSSVAEILVSIIELLSENQNIIDNNIATCLLTGILSDTGSFQNNNTTAKSLTVGAQMIAAGADHQAIIKNLFKTQTLSELKSWGKILTNLQIRPSLKLAWSKISNAELKEIGANPEETGGVIDALIKNLPDIDIFVLLTQTDELIKGSLRSRPNIDINPIATELGGGGHPQASGFRLYEMTLLEGEEKVLSTIEKHLKTPRPTYNTPSSPTPPATNQLDRVDRPTISTNNHQDPSSSPMDSIDPSELDFDPNAEPFDPTNPPDQNFSHQHRETDNY